ncbi:class I SAM-dependent methyltransferase [Psychrosphaera ytuae]|uniref:Class I SAM-dependent methyltransferase n=1 Tax=Psychrosphaera ytuae TaxID=2820710 RepID=A0A975D9M8_9GAMM|nr:class I SAM-dependent methyltransferase [Psychrosphaera ytuae]QTH63067.1 class I SAM-dependent methyltransferase [Psychrosphaera ytuae]
MELHSFQIIEDFLSKNVNLTDSCQLGYFLDHKKRFQNDLELLLKLNPKGPILEIGSAPGHMTALLSLHNLDVVGVDLKPERIAPIIEEFKLNIHACNIELSPLPFPDNSFEYIIFSEVFEHLRIDLPFTLSQLNRVLKPGGKLLLTTPNVYSLPSIARFLTGRSIADPVIEFSKLRGLGHMGHVREYSSKEVGRCLEASGFVVNSTTYRYHKNNRSKKKALLTLAYRVVPSKFHREIVILAEKVYNAGKFDSVITSPKARY